MRYIQKPLEVEAIQWYPNIEHPGVYKYAISQECSEDEQGNLIFGEVTKWGYTIADSLGAHMKLAPGQWIVTSPEGKYYLYSDEVFKKRYTEFPG